MRPPQGRRSLLVAVLTAVASLAAVMSLATAPAHAALRWRTPPSAPTVRYGLGTATATAPCPRYAAGMRGTCVYAFGGKDSAGRYLNTMEAYSPATHRWAALPSMPTARYGLAGTAAPCPRRVSGLLGECVYAIGGYNRDGYSNAVDAYSPLTDRWVALPSLPYAPYDPAVAVTNCPRGVVGLRGMCVYVYGGQVAYATYVSMAVAYSPLTDRWVSLQSMPTARPVLAANRPAPARCCRNRTRHR